MWAFFGVLVAMLIGSAVVGTRTVHAASCTTAQCSTAQTRAFRVCQAGGHGGVGYFECPVSGETDDYFFICSDTQYVEQDDCGTNSPS